MGWEMLIRSLFKALGIQVDPEQVKTAIDRLMTEAPQFLSSTIAKLAELDARLAEIQKSIEELKANVSAARPVS